MGCATDGRVATERQSQHLWVRLGLHQILRRSAESSPRCSTADLSRKNCVQVYPEPLAVELFFINFLVTTALWYEANQKLKTIVLVLLNVCQYVLFPVHLFVLAMNSALLCLLPSFWEWKSLKCKPKMKLIFWLKQLNLTMKTKCNIFMISGSAGSQLVLFLSKWGPIRAITKLAGAGVVPHAENMTNWLS